MTSVVLESPFTTPLGLDVPPSLITELMIIVPLFFIAIVVLLYTPLHWGVLLAITLMDCGIAYYFIRLHYWQNLKSSILEINQDTNKQWFVLSNAKENDWQPVVLRKNSFVSTYLVVLNFQGERRRHSVIFPAGSLDEDTFRRLRVRIKVAFD